LWKGAHDIKKWTHCPDEKGNFREISWESSLSELSKKMLNRNYIGKMDGEKGMEFMAEESAQEK